MTAEGSQKKNFLFCPKKIGPKINWPTDLPTPLRLPLVAQNSFAPGVVEGDFFACWPKLASGAQAEGQSGGAKFPNLPRVDNAPGIWLAREGRGGGDVPQHEKWGNHSGGGEGSRK